MKIQRGDVVIADFPYQDTPGSKVRPALVIQNDADNVATANTVLLMITGNLADVGKRTNLMVDPASPDAASSGLSGPSLVKCCNIAAIRQRRIIRVIGQFSDALMLQINNCIRVAFSIP